MLQNFSDPTALPAKVRIFSVVCRPPARSEESRLTAANNSPGSNGLGRIQSGTLELSNVDLSAQFAELITTQRAFQAGSRIITVSDTVLEDVINLKR